MATALGTLKTHFKSYSYMYLGGLGEVEVGRDSPVGSNDQRDKE